MNVGRDVEMALCNADRSFPCRALPDPELDLEGWEAAAMPAAIRLVRADLTADLVGLATRRLDRSSRPAGLVSRSYRSAHDWDRRIWPQTA